MAIFNSLGSNYNFDFVLKSLFGTGNSKQELQNLLKDKYKGEVYLVYKGREALRLALRMINKKGKVAICGFTCFAVYDAVVKEGYEVEYLDIEKNSLNFSPETLKHHVQENPEIKIVIIQNTLGYPCEMEEISAYCKEKNIILIEDLAHSIGTLYKNGKEAGSFGDFVVLSFSQDKVVDGISGGALIIKSKNFKAQDYTAEKISGQKQLIDKWYPLFTYKIRKEYPIGLGKIYHSVLKKIRLLSNPMSNSDAIHDLPNWYCELIYREFLELDKNLEHRKKIAMIYARRLSKKMLFDDFEKFIPLSTNLRFPIFIENRQDLIQQLKQKNIFVSDIWYDSPIAPKKYLSRTNYKNQCPQSEELSAAILNLPTHKNVSEKDARYIADIINQWEVLQ